MISAITKLCAIIQTYKDFNPLTIFVNFVGHFSPNSKVRKRYSKGR
jgi:hypothetical protein